MIIVFRDQFYIAYFDDLQIFHLLLSYVILYIHLLTLESICNFFYFSYRVYNPVRSELIIMMINMNPHLNVKLSLLNLLRSIRGRVKRPKLGGTTLQE